MKTKATPISPWARSAGPAPLHRRCLFCLIAASVTSPACGDDDSGDTTGDAVSADEEAAGQDESQDSSEASSLDDTADDSSRADEQTEPGTAPPTDQTSDADDPSSDETTPATTSNEDSATSEPDSMGTATETAGDSLDAGVPLDASVVDSETDAALREASANLDADAEACVPYVMPDDCVIPENAVLPQDLRCTGLYSDWQSRTLRCGVREYTPAYRLWSDGLEKTRYVELPAGASVDVTDPNDFQYPTGTQFWKEFRFPGGKLAETRLMRRLERGWIYTTYVWNDDETEATQENYGVQDLHGNGHTVPSREQCKECHSGRPDFILGWDAVMLGPGASGVTRETLVSEGLVTWSEQDQGAPNPLDVMIPGDDVERAALGYLHANCGVSCHNETTDALALETGYFTRLDVETLIGSVQETNTFATGLERLPSPNAPLSELPPAPEGGTYVDLRPLDPERSLVLVRMKRRNEEAAMPRLGTNVVDEDGVAAVQAWIESMTEDRGYPAPQ